MSGAQARVAMEVLYSKGCVVIVPCELRVIFLPYGC